MLLTIEENSSEWYLMIFNYLKDGTFPEPTIKNTHNRLQKLASWYIMLVYVLYRRYFDGPLLRFLNQYEISIALVEAHVGACGGNF